MKSERNRLVEPSLTVFIQRLLTRIRTLESEAYFLSKSISQASTHREKDKLKEAFREKSAKKIELSKSLNEEVKNQIRNLNCKINHRLTDERDIPKTKKAVVKKSKFIRKRKSLTEIQRSPPSPVCFCDRLIETELLVCSNDLCRIKYFHPECIGEGKVNQQDWVCEECQSN